MRERPLFKPTVKAGRYQVTELSLQTFTLMGSTDSGSWTESYWHELNTSEGFLTDHNERGSFKGHTEVRKLSESYAGKDAENSKLILVFPDSPALEDLDSSWFIAGLFD